MLNYVSVIVTTLNKPNVLAWVLQALIAQKTHRSFEIIVADHGSVDDTATLIREIKESTDIPILHVWQPDPQKVACIRNKAFMASEGNYILFLNEGCIPDEHFIEQHLRCAKRGMSVCGSQILLSPNFTESILAEGQFPKRSGLYWGYQWFKGQSDSFISLLNRLWVFKRPHFSNRRFIAHLGVWRSAVQQINGWEESRAVDIEASDFLARLDKAGTPCQYIPFGLSVFQLWDHKLLELYSVTKLDEVLVPCAEHGLNQYDT